MLRKSWVADRMCSMSVFPRLPIKPHRLDEVHKQNLRINDCGVMLGLHIAGDFANI